MTEDNQKISSQVIAWATGQPFNNVLLLAILFAIGWSSAAGARAPASSSCTSTISTAAST